MQISDVETRKKQYNQPKSGMCTGRGGRIECYCLYFMCINNTIVVENALRLN